MVFRRMQVRHAPFSQMTVRCVLISFVTKARYLVRHMHKFAGQNDSKAPPKERRNAIIMSCKPPVVAPDKLG